MAVAMSKTREQFPLSTKKVLKKSITGIIVWTVILLVPYLFVAFILMASSNHSALLITSLGFLIFLSLVFLILYLYQRWYYNVYFYDLTSDYIIIKKGPITPREITIPYERVQDVYVDQDIFDRFLGLYDVHLSSATISSGMEAHIDGVEKPAADGLRALLLQTVSQRISKNKGQSIPIPPAQPTTQ